MADRQVKFWGPPEAERLIHDDIDEAVGEILDDMYPTPISELPETIEVVGYAPVTVSTDFISSVYSPLEMVIDHLEEDFGDPEGLYEINVTENMKNAEKRFLEVIRAEYQRQCRACEEITRVTINVREWIEKHRREWLEDENGLQRE